MKIMKTTLFVVFVHASLVMSGCATNSPTLDSSKLEGSKWHYTDKDWQYDLEFASNGILYTTHPNDKSKGNDTWEQDGTTVLFYYNNKFSKYTGSLSANNIMSGSAKNKNGATWVWKATRAN